MLILNRKAGESFTIDGQIKIKILNDHGTVRVGIEAPKHIRIVRDTSRDNTQRQSKNNKNDFRAGAQYENTRPE